MPAFSLMTPPTQNSKSLINEIRKVGYSCSGNNVAANMARTVWQIERVEHPPIPLYSVIKKIGIQVIQEPNLSSKVIMDNTGKLGEEKIWVRSDLNKANKRIAIAHALGHALMHDWKVNYHCNCDIVIDQHYKIPSLAAEKAANEFASLLLCPAWMVEGYSSVINPDESGKLFHINENAVRHVQSKMFDCILPVKRIL